VTCTAAIRYDCGMRKYVTRQQRWLEDLLQRTQIQRPWRMPDLMEGQSRHRRCAQETPTKRFTRLALTETRCVTMDAALGAHVVENSWMCAREVR
jgi:hypothetical protein